MDANLFIYLFILYLTLTIQLKNTVYKLFSYRKLLIYVNHLSKKPILRKIKGKIYSWLNIHTKYTNICKKEAEADAGNSNRQNVFREILRLQ